MSKQVIRLQLYRYLYDEEGKDDYTKYFICDSENIAKDEYERIIKNFYNQEKGEFKDYYVVFYNEILNPDDFGCYKYLDNEYYYGHRFKNDDDYEVQFYLQIKELEISSNEIVNVWNN